MIYVRDDDVLLSSTSCPDPLKRFKAVHVLVCKAPSKLIHVPTILVEEIEKFPEAVQFIKSEYDAGRLLPELHGLQHIDYGKLDDDEVREHLDKSCEWFKKNLNTLPVFWYTPWGASQPHLHKIAKEYNMKLVDCSATTKMVGRYGIIQKLREGWPIDRFSEVIIHWWRGQDVERLGWLVEYIHTGVINGRV